MNDIQIKKIKVLSGANIWAYRPVIEILTDIGKYEYLPSNEILGFTERLVDLIPSLWEHRCSEGRPGGFLERLRIGTYMGHIIEHIILELQSLTGMDVGFGRTRGTERKGEYRIVADYLDAEAAKECAYLAVEIVEHLAENVPLPFTLQDRLQKVREIGEDNMLGPSTQTIVDAARARRIPWFRLNNAGLVQLGHGKYARRVQAAESTLTSNIGVEIASDKELTKDLLDKVGVPVPNGEVVSSGEAAWQAAQEMGCSVVLKPYNGNQGKAVSVNLTTEEQVRAAYDLAALFGRNVIVERYLPGSDYRLLVINGQLVAAAQRSAPQVVTDGRGNIRELVERVNSDPRRGHGHGSALTRIKMDAAAELTLAKQGLTWESVPPAGQVVMLRDNSNLSTGGTATDVTDEVHPDNAAIAVLAAQTIGLDIAGVDVVCNNIRRPLAEQGGGIVEVNAAPGLRMHVFPSEGKSRPVGRAIVDMLFPRGSDARVPLIAVTGTNGKTTVTRMIAHIYSTMHRYVGMTTTDGIYFGGTRRVKADASGPRSAESVLQHPMVEVAVLETARGGILRSGLAWDRSACSVVLNVANDHMGLEGIDTPEQLARVKGVIVESVSSDGYAILNADDRLVVEMAERCPGGIIYFGMDCSNAVISGHLADGGKAAYITDGKLVLAEGTEETTLIRASDIPATYGGLIPFQVLNSLAAGAACWGAGVPIESIRLGLRTFQTDEKTAPGRFNLFNVGKARVIVDYGHNPHALRAVQGAISQMRPRRSIGVIASPGDRRDVDIQELAIVAANTFDWVIIREDDSLRGRERGEVSQLIAETITRVKPSLSITIIIDEMEAVSQALEMARSGDLVVLFADHVDETIEQVKLAGKVAEKEESDAFFCPVPEPSGSKRSAEAHSNVVTRGVPAKSNPGQRSDGGNMGSNGIQRTGSGNETNGDGSSRVPTGADTGMENIYDDLDEAGSQSSLALKERGTR
ncbi:MAG: cyanophycin synthetase [Chloroflexota bacterium]|nr:cyanophycin synthetase [Chloroflexota bacterium]